MDVYPIPEAAAAYDQAEQLVHPVEALASALHGRLASTFEAAMQPLDQTNGAVATKLRRLATGSVKPVATAAQVARDVLSGRGQAAVTAAVERATKAAGAGAVALPTTDLPRPPSPGRPGDPIVPDQWYVVCRLNVVPTVVTSGQLETVYTPERGWVRLGGPFDTVTGAIAYAQLSPRNCPVGDAPPPDLPPCSTWWVVTTRTPFGPRTCRVLCSADAPELTDLEELRGPLGSREQAVGLADKLCVGEPTVVTWYSLWVNPAVCLWECVREGDPDPAGPGWKKKGRYEGSDKCQEAGEEWEASDECEQPPPAPPACPADDCAETCPPPPDADKVTAAPAKGIPDWRSRDFCAQLEALQRGEGTAQEIMGSVFALAAERDLPKVYAWIDEYLGGKLLAPVRPLVKAGAWVFDAALAGLEAFAQPGGECDRKQLIIYELAAAVVGAVEKWTGLKLDSIEKQLSRVSDYMCPSGMPSVGDADQTFLHGALTKEEWRCWVRMNNVVDIHHWRVMYSRRAKPNAQATDSLFRRGFLDEDTWKAYQRQNGFIDDGERDLHFHESDYRPSIRDALAWADLGVPDERIAGRLGLDEGIGEEMGERIHAWLKGAGCDDDMIRWLWRAHWSLPGRGERAEQLYRLRPGARPDGLAYTMDDYLLDLERAGLSPEDRAQDAAIAYRALSVGEVRALYQQGLTDEPRLKGAYQDAGTSEADADRMMARERPLKARARAGESRGFAIGNVPLFVRLGLMKEKEGRFYLEEQGWTPGEISSALTAEQYRYTARLTERATVQARRGYARGLVAAYEGGTVGADQASQGLQAAGYLPDAAALVLATADLKETTALLKEGAAAVKKGYMGGELSTEGALGTLLTLGMDAAHAQRRVSAWSAERSVQHKHLAAGAIIKAVEEGLLPPSQARARLVALGWTNPDIAIMLSEARAKITETAAKAEAAATKAEGRQRKEMEALVKQAERDLAAYRRQLQKLQPVGQLHRWFVRGEVNSDYVRTRLDAYGYDTDSIARYLTDWQREKTEKAAGS